MNIDLERVRGRFAYYGNVVGFFFLSDALALTGWPSERLSPSAAARKGTGFRTGRPTSGTVRARPINYNKLSHRPISTTRTRESIRRSNRKPIRTVRLRSPAQKPGTTNTNTTNTHT